MKSRGNSDVDEHDRSPDVALKARFVDGLFSQQHSAATIAEKVKVA
jgi:hypothetical protein